MLVAILEAQTMLSLLIKAFKGKGFGKSGGKSKGQGDGSLGCKVLTRWCRHIVENDFRSKSIHCRQNPVTGSQPVSKCLSLIHDMVSRAILKELF